MRLNSNGILQQWFPGGEKKILRAVTRSLVETFPHVKVYQSLDGWGFHFIASLSPIVPPTPDELIARMPPDARDDLLEWSPGSDINSVAHQLLGGEIPLWAILNEDQGIAITDDRPFNEYFFLRRLMGWWKRDNIYSY